MAGKNQVTLTFAGDSQQLERTLDKVGSSSQQLEGKLDGVGSGLDRVRSVGSSSRADLDQYGNGLDRLGESADVGETRFTGLASGIDGATTLMGDPSPQEMAQGIADLSDGVANSLAPALKSGVDALKGMNKATLAAAGGIALAGAGLVAYGLMNREVKLDIDAFAEGLRSVDAAVREQMTRNVEILDSWNQVDEVFGRLLDSAPQMADEFIAQAEAAGVSEEQLAGMRDRLEDVADTSSFAADEIRGVQDALRAMTDPAFAAIDAGRELADANADIAVKMAELTAAEAEFGVGSAEAVEASEALRQAHQDAAQAALDNEQALYDLGVSMLEGGTSIQDVITHLQGLADQGVISQETVNNVGWSLSALPKETIIALNATDGVTDKIGKVLGELAKLPTELSISLKATGGIGKRAAGGPVAAGSPYFVGEAGTELFVPDRDGTILSHAETMAALGSGGGSAVGGVTVNLYVQGSIRSDRDLVRLIRDDLARGGLRGVLP